MPLGMSKKIDKQIAKKESDNKRHAKKNSRPHDNYGDQYVTGLERMRTQGKGDKLRDADGAWYSQEVTDRLNKIFKKGDSDATEKAEQETDE